MKKENLFKMLIAWVFYIGGFILLEIWFDDWRLGFCMMLFIAGNNLERSRFDI